MKDTQSRETQKETYNKTLTLTERERNRLTRERNIQTETERVVGKETDRNKKTQKE